MSINSQLELETNNLSNKTKLREILDFVLLDKKNELSFNEFDTDELLLNFHNIFTNLLDVYEIKLSLYYDEEDDYSYITIQILNTNSFIYINYTDDEIELILKEEGDIEGKLIITLSYMSINVLFKIYSLIKINIYLRKGNETEINKDTYIYRNIELCQYNPIKEIINILIDTSYSPFGNFIHLENLIKNTITLLKKIIIMSSNNFINLQSSDSDYVSLDKLELIKEISKLPNKTELKDILENETVNLFVKSVSKLLNKKKNKLEELLDPNKFNYSNYLLSFHNIFTNLLDVYEIKLSTDDKNDDELYSISINILNNDFLINIDYDYHNAEINVFLTEDKKSKLLITLRDIGLKSMYEIYSLIKINIYLRKGNETEINENTYIYKGIELCQYNPSEEIISIIRDTNSNSVGDLVQLENLIKKTVTLLKK